MLPKILKPYHINKSNLIRIGPEKDGGYIVDKRILNKSKVVITLGLNDDWDFEKDGPVTLDGEWKLSDMARTFAAYT